MSHQLKIKLVHPDAEMPQYATSGAACFDLKAVGINGFTKAEHETLERAGVYQYVETIDPGKAREFSTGLAFEVPPGWVLKIYSRSGHGFHHGIRLSNGTGIVDSDYRGEVKLKLHNDGDRPFNIRHGERIAQAMLVPADRFDMVQVDELSETQRGAGGFGSTGK